jgi:hypothetical protein
MWLREIKSSFTQFTSGSVSASGIAHHPPTNSSFFFPSMQKEESDWGRERDDDEV